MGGQENAADVLSRLPVGRTQDEDARATEEFASSVASGAMPTALLHEETASGNDPTLRLVRQALTINDWSQLQSTTYKEVEEELWVLRQVVIRGSRIVIPQSLWDQTIKLAHEGHQAMVQAKAGPGEKV